jgi:hypothetical protein
MPQRPCLKCGRLTPSGSYCAEHQPDNQRERSTPGRSSRPQARFSQSVIERAGGRCEWQENGQRCEATANLQAHHLAPFRQSRSYDPADGVALCPRHHSAVERAQRDDAAHDLMLAGLQAWATKTKTHANAVF